MRTVLKWNYNLQLELNHEWRTKLTFSMGWKIARKCGNISIIGHMAKTVSIAQLCVSCSVTASYIELHLLTSKKIKVDQL
jgi:hypothetical protein